MITLKRITYKILTTNHREFCQSIYMFKKIVRLYNAIIFIYYVSICCINFCIKAINQNMRGLLDYYN